jgi:hypothetical protein
MRCFVVILASLLVSGGCCACPPAPHAGVETPVELVDNFVHAVREKCRSSSYDLLSDQTRAELPYAAWLLGADSATLPGTDVTLRAIIAEGETIEVLPVPESLEKPGEQARLWLFQDNMELAEGQDRCRLFNVLLVSSEAMPWRVGIQDQIDRGIPFCAE